MSTNDIFSLKKWLIGVSVLMGAQFGGVVWMGITDHFRLEALNDKMAIVEPRVEKLWWQNSNNNP